LSGVLRRSAGLASSSAMRAFNIFTLRQQFVDALIPGGDLRTSRSIRDKGSDTPEAQSISAGIVPALRLASVNQSPPIGSPLKTPSHNAAQRVRITRSNAGAPRKRYLGTEQRTCNDAQPSVRRLSDEHVRRSEALNAGIC